MLAARPAPSPLMAPSLINAAVLLDACACADMPPSREHCGFERRLDHGRHNIVQQACAVVKAPPRYTPRCWAHRRRWRRRRRAYPAAKQRLDTHPRQVLQKTLSSGHVAPHESNKRALRLGREGLREVFCKQASRRGSMQAAVSACHAQGPMSSARYRRSDTSPGRSATPPRPEANQAPNRRS